MTEDEPYVRAVIENCVQAFRAYSASEDPERALAILIAQFAYKACGENVRRAELVLLAAVDDLDECVSARPVA